MLEAVRWRHGPPAWRSLLLTPSRKMRSVLNCLLPLYSMSSLLESLKVSMSFNEPRNYTTGREIIAKKFLKTHRLSGKAYKDLDSTVVIVIFY